MSGAPGTVEYGTRLNCEKEGCLEKLGYLHSDNGRVIVETDWRPRLRNDDLADRLEYCGAGHNGHAVDIVTRILPEWTTLTDTEVTEVVSHLRNTPDKSQ